MLRGIEYLEELGNAQLWQILIAGSWRDKCLTHEEVLCMFSFVCCSRMSR